MRAMLVDTGFSSEPLLRAAHALGYEVAAIGNRPDDVLVRAAFCYFKADYSNTTSLREHFIEGQCTALIPGCTDVSYMSSSHLCGIAGVHNIDSYDQSLQTFDKSNFRSICRTLHIPAPQTYEHFDDIDPDAKVIVKPVDAYSGRGISVLKLGNEVELELAINNAKVHSPSNRFLVEDFIEGKLFSSSIFIKNGKVANSFLVEEYCGAGSFSVSLSRVLSDSPGSSRRGVELAMEQISRHLSLCDGLMHVQWIENSEGFRLIELTRRCPGDLYARLIELSTGFDYANAYVAPFLNADIPKTLHPEEAPSNILRVTVKGPAHTILTRLEFHGSHHVVEYHPLVKLGEEIDESGRVGILFVALSAEYQSGRIDASLERSLYNVVCVKH